MSCDIVLIGVGGQGILAIGDLLVRAAFASGLPVSFCPTKGMAQRGGFVMGEVRIGLEHAGMRIPPAGADIVIAMERSEAVKGIGYVKQDGTFLLYDEALLPTGVVLGRDHYPDRDDLLRAIRDSGADLRILDPKRRPASLERAIGERWPGRARANIAAYRAGRAASGGSWT